MKITKGLNMNEFQFFLMQLNILIQQALSNIITLVPSIVISLIIFEKIKRKL